MTNAPDMGYNLWGNGRYWLSPAMGPDGISVESCAHLCFWITDTNPGILPEEERNNLCVQY